MRAYADSSISSSSSSSVITSHHLLNKKSPSTSFNFQHNYNYNKWKQPPPVATAPPPPPPPPPQTPHLIIDPLSTPSPSATARSSFRIRFKLERILSSSAASWTPAPLDFLLLKQQQQQQQQSQSAVFYLLGISANGFLTLRKYQTSSSSSLSNVSSFSPWADRVQLAWSLSNDKVNLSRGQLLVQPLAVRLKLNEHRVEMSVNGSTHVARFDLTSSSEEDKDKRRRERPGRVFGGIEALKVGFFFSSSPPPTTATVSFALSELSIDGRSYEPLPRALKQRQLELVTFEQHRRPRPHRTRALAVHGGHTLELFNASAALASLVRALNRNTNYCHRTSSSCFNLQPPPPPPPLAMESTQPRHVTCSSEQACGEYATISQRRDSRTTSYVLYTFDLNNQQQTSSEFYSLAFDLSFNSSSSLKTSLFTLAPSRDISEPPSQLLFGLNLWLVRSSLGLAYQLELTTAGSAAKSAKSEPIRYVESTTVSRRLNITFAADSITLVDEQQQQPLVRLSSASRGSQLFQASTFHFNVTSSTDSRAATPAAELPPSVATCLSNVAVATRPRDKGYASKYEPFSSSSVYSLIELTRSLTVWQQQESTSALDGDETLTFEASTCPLMRSTHWPRGRLILDANDTRCFLVSKVDASTSRTLATVFDCSANDATTAKCNSSSSSSSTSNCSFWSSQEDEDDADAGGEQTTSMTLGERSSAGSTKAGGDLGGVVVVVANPLERTCNYSSEFACFNDGTCVDTPAGYKCDCPDGFVGTR